MVTSAFPVSKPKPKPAEMPAKKSPEVVQDKANKKEEPNSVEEGEEINMEKLFTGRTSSRGRRVKPTSKVSQCVATGESVQSGQWNLVSSTTMAE